MNNKDIWDTSIFEKSPIINQLKPYLSLFEQYTSWPTIKDYENIFKKNQLKIKPVPQSLKISSFEEQYESRVYLKNELQTRTENWHDFFNAIIWLKFPITKKTLNDLHYQQAINRPKGSNRSLLENRITQFDECGAIIISNNQALLDLVKDHKWEELFIKNRHQFEKNFKCIVFGHAIFEKAFDPYIGMTCHCILIHEPKRLHSFPILGIPNYYINQSDSFYQNSTYFR